MRDLISIIMNCKNGEIYLKKSISSIISQTYKNWELIFYDNCSKDSSISIARSFKNKKIKIFKARKSLKLYEARNEAVKLANGKYITFLDTDDYWNKKKLLIQIQFLKKEKLRFCYTNYYCLFKKKKKIYTKRKKKEITTQSLLEDYNIGVITVMIEKKLLLQNKFNNKFDIIGDFDLFIKLSEMLQIGYIHKPLATYRLHALSLSQKKKSIYINELNYWIKKNMSKLKKKKLSIDKIKIFLIKLKIKSFFNIN